MDWFNAPTHTGLWWLDGPDCQPEPVRVRLNLDGDLVAEMIGHEDDFALDEFKDNSRWLPVQMPQQPQ
jgi:hypothetical protein